MAEINALSFLIGSTIFFLVGSQLMAYIGVTVFSQELGTISLACEETDFISIVSCGLSNFTIFFRLMTLSSEFFVINTIIVTPALIGYLWIISSWLRGVSS